MIDMKKPMNSSAQLVICDDNPRDREFIADLLKNYHPVLTANAKEAMEALAELKDPYLVSDIQMPDCNGIELARRIWARDENARILFWSQHDDEAYVRALAKLIPPVTVYGYILKNNSAETISRAARAVFEECQCWIDPIVRRVQARSNGRHNTLTDAEYDVLIDIALGLTDNAIAERRYLSRRGVQNRLQSLYTKLGANLENLVESDAKASDVLNIRARAVSIAFQRGLVNAFELKNEEQNFNRWLQSRM